MYNMAQSASHTASPDFLGIESFWENQVRIRRTNEEMTDSVKVSSPKRTKIYLSTHCLALNQNK